MCAMIAPTGGFLVSHPRDLLIWGRQRPLNCIAVSACMICVIKGPWRDEAINPIYERVFHQMV